jgi:hypothetical protein
MAGSTNRRVVVQAGSGIKGYTLSQKQQKGLEVVGHLLKKDEVLSSDLVLPPKKDKELFNRGIPCSTM